MSATRIEDIGRLRQMEQKPDKVIIPAVGHGYELLRVWRNGAFDTLPVLALVVDTRRFCELEVITPTGDQLDNDLGHLGPADFVTALVLPDKRVVYAGLDFPNAEAFVRAHRNRSKKKALLSVVSAKRA